MITGGRHIDYGRSWRVFANVGSIFSTKTKDVNGERLPSFACPPDFQSSSSSSSFSLSCFQGYGWTMDLKDACDRIKFASSDDWTTHSRDLVDVWTHLTLCLLRSLVDIGSDSSTAHQNARNISLYLQSQPATDPPVDNGEGAWTSSCSTHPTSPSSASSYSIPSTTGIVRTRPAKTNLTAVPKLRLPTSRHERMRQSIIRNASARYKVLHGIDI